MPKAYKSDYEEIFSPETLKKLDKKSLENLRRVSGGGSGMSLMGKVQELSPQIIQAEKPYINELQLLAQVIVLDMYDIADDQQVEFDLKIVPSVDVEADKDDDIDLPETPDIDKTTKRRLINSITQGGSVKGTFSFLLFKEYLDDINDQLIDKYKEIMEASFGVFDDENLIAMMMSVMAGGSGGEGGSAAGKSEIEWDEDKEKFIIHAEAVMFPVLVHEAIKGLYEVIGASGFSDDDQDVSKVLKQTDRLSNEPEDLRYGKFVYEAIIDMINNSRASLKQIRFNKVRDYFLTELYKLDGEDLVSIIDNAISGKLTNSQLRWIDRTIEDIVDDFTKFDSGMFDDDDDFGDDDYDMDEPEGIYETNNDKKMKSKLRELLDEYKEEVESNKPLTKPKPTTKPDTKPKPRTPRRIKPNPGYKPDPKALHEDDYKNNDAFNKVLQKYSSMKK